MANQLMPATFRNRQAYRLENEQLRLTIVAEGGHIAELLHKRTKINPMWSPPWPTIDPSQYSRSKHPEYGADSESQLLAGILGHNLCIDFFGPPSPAEAAAGYTVHGEASLLPYDKQLNCHLKLSHLKLRREIQLEGLTVKVTEEVENLLPFDRDIAWQEHATLGPPFVERGITRIEAPVLRSARLDETEFEWRDRAYPKAERSGGYHTNLLSAGYADIVNEHLQLGIRYSWNVEDFPWLGVWEENCSRTTPPWNGKTITWGIEFGSSPYPELRSKRAARGKMWGAPTGIWLPALGKRSISYSIELRELG